MLREADVVRKVERITVERLRVWVERGWIKPVRRGRALTYSETDVARISLICDLSDIMEISDDSVPVVLHLIDQIHGLRHEMKVLLAAIDELPEDVRASIKARISRSESG